MIRFPVITHYLAMVMIRLLSLILFLIPLSAMAQEDALDCSIARDPERCLIHQNALTACADERGKNKRDCLAAHIPPVDCSKAENPDRCEAVERAKKTCEGKSGQALKTCLKGGKSSKKNQKATKTKKPKKAHPAKKTKTTK